MVTQNRNNRAEKSRSDAMDCKRLTSSAGGHIRKKPGKMAVLWESRRRRTKAYLRLRQTLRRRRSQAHRGTMSYRLCDALSHTECNPVPDKFLLLFLPIRPYRKKHGGHDAAESLAGVCVSWGDESSACQSPPIGDVVRPPSLHISHEDEIRKSTPAPRLRRGDEEERTRRGRQPAMDTRGLRHGDHRPTR